MKVAREERKEAITLRRIFSDASNILLESSSSLRMAISMEPSSSETISPSSALRSDRRIFLCEGLRRCSFGLAVAVVDPAATAKSSSRSRLPRLPGLGGEGLVCRFVAVCRDLLRLRRRCWCSYEVSEIKQRPR